MTDPTQLASDRPSMRSSVIADRVAGMTYIDISNKYRVPEPTVARWCRLAARDGLVTPEQIRLGMRPSHRDNDGKYNAKWITRVKKKVQVDDNGCWIWTGFKHAKGYGGTHYRGGATRVHRAMYQAFHNVRLGSLEFVCHKCDVPACCNPDHLFLGDYKSNMDDKTAKGRHHELRVTHCPLNHPYDAENTYYAPNGSRHCKACKRYQLRLKAGWPEHLAAHPGKIPAGYSREVLL